MTVCPLRPLGCLALAAAVAACSPSVTTAAKAPARTSKALEELPWRSPSLEKALELGGRHAHSWPDGFGMTGDRLVHPIQVEPGACLLLLADGSDEVEDVDAFIFGEDGSLLASDERSSRDARTLLCPPLPERVFVVARFAAGHGRVVLSALWLTGEATSRVQRALGLGPRPSRQQLASDEWPGLEATIDERQRSLGIEFANPRKIAVPIDSRVPTRLSLQLERPGCLDIVVVPSTDVAFLDAVVYDTEERIVGQATAVERNRFVLLCSSNPSHFSLDLRPRAGSGLVAVAIARADLAAVDHLNRNVVRLDAVARRPLAQAVAGRLQQLAALGHSDASHVQTIALRPGRRESLDLHLAPGCSRLDLVGGPGGGEVRAWLWSAAGTLVARAQGSAAATLYHCGERRETRLDVESGGKGSELAIIQAHHEAAPEAYRRYPLAASRLLALLHQRFAVERPERGGAPNPHELAAGRLVRLPLHVPLQRCLSVAAATELGASGLEIRLLDERNRELESAYGRTAAAVRLCTLRPSRPIQGTIELRVRSGEATALVSTLLETPEPPLGRPSASPSHEADASPKRRATQGAVEGTTLRTSTR